MTEIRVTAPSALAVPSTQRDGRGGDRRREPDEHGAKRQATLAHLLYDHGVDMDAEQELTVQMVTDTASGESWVRVQDARTGATLLEVATTALAAAASAQQMYEGLLVERSS